MIESRVSARSQRMAEIARGQMSDKDEGVSPTIEIETSAEIARGQLSDQY